MGTIKVRMQTAASTHCKNRGMFSCFIQILRTEGTQGLFRGMSSPLVGMCFINAVVFGVEAQARSFFNKSSYECYFASGCVAGFAHALVSCPIELVKIQMQSLSVDGTKARYNSVFHAIKDVHRQRGLAGFSRGMVSTVIQDVPSFGCYFVAFEFLNSAETRRVFTNKSHENNFKDTAQILVAGGIAGQIAWISTYPFDVVKSQVQAETVAKRTSASTGLMQSMLRLYKNEGFQVFFRGLSPVLLRAFPVNAVTFAVVHFSNSYLNNNLSSHNLCISDAGNDCSKLIPATVFSSLSST